MALYSSPKLLFAGGNWAPGCCIIVHPCISAPTPGVHAASADHGGVCLSARQRHLKRLRARPWRQGAGGSRCFGAGLIGFIVWSKSRSRSLGVCGRTWAKARENAMACLKPCAWQMRRGWWQEKLEPESHGFKTIQRGGDNGRSIDGFCMASPQLARKSCTRTLFRVV